VNLQQNLASGLNARISGVEHFGHGGRMRSMQSRIAETATSFTCFIRLRSGIANSLQAKRPSIQGLGLAFEQYCGGKRLFVARTGPAAGWTDPLANGRPRANPGGLSESPSVIGMSLVLVCGSPGSRRYRQSAI
jgi:hypothetical protein